MYIVKNKRGVVIIVVFCKRCNKTDIIVQKLMDFMENEECPTKDEGNQITQELYKEIEKLLLSLHQFPMK